MRLLPVPYASRFLLALFLSHYPATSRAVDTQASFRVRVDFAAPLNTDAGWAASLNEPATIHADQPFRLRFEIETTPATNNPSPGGAATERAFKLQYRRNQDPWTDLEPHDFPHPEGENARTPRASLVACPAYTSGAATTNLLTGSSAPFRPGSAIGLAARTSPWPPAINATANPVTTTTTALHTEFEFAIVVRRFADAAVTNEPGDIFSFRVADAAGEPLTAQHPAALPLAVHPGHVGGTFVETPGRIGPWRAANGDLYFVMEPAETSNLFMMIKSADHGRTWREVDAAHRPPTRDLESVDTRQVGDTIHIVHQVTRSVRYHTFRTSDHPTQPDTWDVRGETAGTVQSVAQAASLVVRSDASLVACYVGQTKTHLSIRSAAGQWSEVAVIEQAVGPQAILGADDTVHLAYYQPNGTLHYRRLARDGTLSAAEQIASGLATTRAEFGSVLPLVFLPRTNTVAILYRLATGHVWERRSTAHAPLSPPRQVTDRPVIHNPVDSQQPTADVVTDGDTLHVLFVDATSRSIYHTHDAPTASQPAARTWQPPTLRVDHIRGSWVRGHISTRSDGAKTYSFIYDAGSEGGAGMNRFDEIILAPPRAR